MQSPYSLFSWCEVDKSVKNREAYKPLPENTFVASNILPIGTVYLKSKEGWGRTAPLLMSSLLNHPWCSASTATTMSFCHKAENLLPCASPLSQESAEARSWGCRYIEIGQKTVILFIFNGNSSQPLCILFKYQKGKKLHTSRLGKVHTFSLWDAYPTAVVNLSWMSQFLKRA